MQDGLVGLFFFPELGLTLGGDSCIISEHINARKWVGSSLWGKCLGGHSVLELPQVLEAEGLAVISLEGIPRPLRVRATRCQEKVGSSYGTTPTA